MRKKRVITLDEQKALRESLRRAYRALGSWDAVGKRVLGKSGAYAWRVVYQGLPPSDEAVYHWREFWCSLPDMLWETTEELMTAAWEIISERVGAEEAIKVSLLAKRLLIHPRRARATVRALRKRGYPICSVRAKGGGYFRPENLAEYRAWRQRSLLRTGLDLLETTEAQRMNEHRWFPLEQTQLPMMAEEAEWMSTG